MIPTLTITIRAGADGRYAVRASLERPQARAQEFSGSLRLDLAELRSLQNLPIDYGTALGLALFDGQIADALRQLLQFDSRPRLLLRVEANDLYELRWGLLCGPILGSTQLAALAGSGRLVFALYVPTSSADSFPTLPPSALRALLLVASPADLPRYHFTPFDTVAAVHAVQTGLSDIPTTLLASPPATGTEAPTLAAMVRCLRGQQHALLHIVCHGRVTSAGPLLFLEGGPGDGRNSHRVKASELVGALNNLAADEKPYLIFLSACQSASAGAEFDSLAEQLVRECGIPAVIAMAGLVSIESAYRLSAAFYPQLIRLGDPALALNAAMEAIQFRDDLAVPYCVTSLIERPIIARDLDIPLTRTEIELGLERLATLCLERAPALLGGELPSLAGKLRARTPQALAAAAQAEYAHDLDTLDALCRTVTDLPFATLARGGEPPPYADAVGAFPGIEAFNSAQQASFFGRTSQIAALVARLQTQIEHGAWSLLTISGPSAVGKTSLLLAGVIPQLERQIVALRSAMICPGDDPLAALAAVPDLPAPGLLLIDQAEALLEAGPDLQRTFAERLIARSLPTVLIVRDQHLADLRGLPLLGQAIIDGASYQVEPLAPADVIEVVRRQADRVGLRFEEGLCAQIVADAGAELARLALIQRGLSDLWAQRRGRWLQRSTYEHLGRLAGILAAGADSAYAQVPPGQRTQAEAVLLLLCSFSLDERTSPDLSLVRRRMRRAELLEWLPAAQAAISWLDRQRLIVEYSDGYELAHPALLSVWREPMRLLRANLGDNRLRERLRQRAAEWHASGRGADRLLRGNDLAAARGLALASRVGQAEQALIQASQAAADGERRRLLRQRTYLMLSLVVSLIAGMVASLFAVAWNRQAERSHALALVSGARAALAENNNGLALALALAAADSGASGPELEATLAEAAYRPGALWPPRSVGTQINQLAISPDGRAALAAGSDGSLALIDMARGDLISRLSGHSGQVLAVTFLSDSEALSGGADGTIRRWDLHSGRQIDLWRGHRGAVTALVPLPGGAELLSGAADHSLRLWRLRDGGDLGLVGQLSGALRGLVLGPDGRYALALLGAGEAPTLWDLRERRLLAVLSDPDLAGAAAATVVSGPGYALALSNGTTIELRDPASGALRSRLTPALTPLSSIAASPNGARIVGGDQDGRIYIWDTRAARLLQTLAGGGSPISDLRFTPDGAAVLSATQAGGLGLIAIGDGAALPHDQRGLDSAPIWALAEPSGASFVLGTRAGSLVRYDPTTGAARTLLAPEPPAPPRLDRYWFSASAGANRLLVAHEQTTPDAAQPQVELRIYDWATMQELARLPLAGLSVAPQISPDAGTLALGDQSGVQLIDLATGRLRAQIPTGHVAALAFSPAGDRLAVGSYAGELLQIDLEASPAILWRKPALKPGLVALAYSPDGADIVAGGAGGALLLLAASDGTELRGLPGFSRNISSIAFSSDGRRLIGGSSEGVVRVWELTSGIELRRFVGAGGPVAAVAISADGRTALASAPELTLWRLDSLPELAAWARDQRSVAALSCAEQATYQLAAAECAE